MRTECRKRGLKKVKVVYSKEAPKNAIAKELSGRHVPGSVSFVPGVAGMILAGEIIKDLTGLC
jgi:tRNA A37 threonylcarbamoyladenosine dehydratase